MRDYRYRLFSFGLMSITLLSAANVAAETSVVRPLITQAINERALTTLAGNTRPEARDFRNVKGALPDSYPIDHIQLLLRRSHESELQLAVYIEGLTRPGAPMFHRWTKAQQIGVEYGPAVGDLEIVARWLMRHGFRINTRYLGNALIDFSGTAGQVRDAFHTTIYVLLVNGKPHIANTSDPQIPSALAPAVAGIVSLNDFRPKPSFDSIKSYNTGPGGCTNPLNQSANCYFVAPADLWKIYDFPTFTNTNAGQGQTIAVIEDSDVYGAADWGTFRTSFGLAGITGGSFNTSHPQNCDPPGATTEDEFEAVLDAEWASAAAPGAAIVLESCKQEGFIPGVVLALENLVYSNAALPTVISISYGGCEKLLGNGLNAAIADALQTAAAEGVSTFVAAGDSGAAQCDDAQPVHQEAKKGISVNGYAATPYAVAVGGTDFADTLNNSNSEYWYQKNSGTYGSAKSYIPEIPWNASCGSTLLSKYVSGSTLTYGDNGFCNSYGGQTFLTVVAGGGGPSSCVQKDILGICQAGYPKPSWQVVLGNPSDSVRDVPDVALFAGSGVWDHAYIVCYTSQTRHCTHNPKSWVWSGGTSFAAPIWAGIQALINQTYGIQGNPAPSLYAAASAEYQSIGSASCNSNLGKAAAKKCVFYDITSGDTDVDCTGANNCFFGSPAGKYGVFSNSNTSYQPAFVEQTGWDFATGIGTPNVSNLISNWNTRIIATSGGWPNTSTSTPPWGAIFPVNSDKITSGTLTYFSAYLGNVFAGSGPEYWTYELFDENYNESLDCHATLVFTGPYANVNNQGNAYTWNSYVVGPFSGSQCNTQSWGSDDVVLRPSGSVQLDSPDNGAEANLWFIAYGFNIRSR